MARGNLAAETNAHRFSQAGGTGIAVRFGWLHGPGAAHSEQLFALARRHCYSLAMPFAQKQQCPHPPQLTRLPDEAGQGVVAERLEEVASQAVRCYERQVSILASLFAEPALLARYRQALATIGAGPHRANQALAAYVRAERELGRIDASVDSDAGAAMLMAHHPHMKTITDTPVTMNKPVTTSDVASFLLVGLPCVASGA
jgi:hypothetical protein